MKPFFLCPVHCSVVPRHFPTLPTIPSLLYSQPLSSSSSNFTPRISARSFPQSLRPARLLLTAALPGPPPVFLGRLGRAAAFNCGLYFVVAVATGAGARVLTPGALAQAAVLGAVVQASFGLGGWLLAALFLLVGAGASRLGFGRKQGAGLAEQVRGVRQLWGAAGVAFLCACLALPRRPPPAAAAAPPLRLAFAAALVTKLMDTVSSEVGKAYGATTVVLPSFAVVPRGTQGGLSLVGTLAGIAAALLASLFAVAVRLVQIQWAPAVVVAALVATTAESYIGANLQERMRWSNEFVNFVNTAIGAVVAWALYCAFRR